MEIDYLKKCYILTFLQMLQTIIFAVGAVAIYNFRAWIIRRISKHHPNRQIRFYVLSVGFFGSVIIFFIPKIISLLGINSEKFAENLNISTIAFDVGYVVIAGLIGYIVYNLKLINKSIVVRIIIFFILFGLVSVLGLLLGIPNFIIYFGLAAFGEEYIKYVFGYSLFDKMKIHFTDILLFCLISAFGFAFIENIFYGFYSIPPNVVGLMPKTNIFLQSIVQRGIINVAIHGFFTSLIARITITNPDGKSKIIKIIFGILAGVTVHRVYNTSISKGIMLVMPIVVLAGYVFVTYVVYKSDTIFSSLDKEKSDKTLEKS